MRGSVELRRRLLLCVGLQRLRVDRQRSDWLHVVRPQHLQVRGQMGSRRYFGDWFGRALDYGFSAVRDYRMALIAEYLELFECDGIELDWLRFPVCLKPGCEIEDAEAVTDVVRRTRKLADAKGEERHCRIKVGVRVPSRPDDARRLGYDVLTWSKEGLLVWLIGVLFWWP